MRVNDRGVERVREARQGQARSAGGGEDPGLAPGRVAEVRRRILEGAYGSPEVVGRVAEAVMRSGHL
jgi:hypothetical protein